MEGNAPRASTPLVRLVGTGRRPSAANGRAKGWSPGGAALAVSVVAVTVGGVVLDEAWSAPGDLDPTFADLGRKSDFGYTSVLRSLDVRSDESVLFAGGLEYDFYYCYYSFYDNCDLVDTFGALSALGAPNPAFVPPDLDQTVIFDAALQSDGRMVATGRARQSDGREKLVVLRLLPDGTLDGSFGAGGQVVVSATTDHFDTGHSLHVHSDGRIVVAGSSNGRVLVARLLANGTLDDTFGTGGVFRSNAQLAVLQPARIGTAPGGGYRVTASEVGAATTSCAVLALTPNGAVDPSFGDDGLQAAPGAAGDGITCTSLAVLPDGRMLLAGNRNSQTAYLGRALADGSTDPAFEQDAMAASLDSVSALAVSQTTGRIFVAGADPNGLGGATIVRLLADGTIDALFGDAGGSVVDPQLPYAWPATILDMQVRADDSLIVAGDALRRPFVARLLGDSGTGGPGVLGMVKEIVVGTEAAGEARVTVRRTGGSTGAVSVSYVTRARNGFPGSTPGQDYTAVAGTLSWADGDRSDREIVVPILANSLAEDFEYLDVALEDPEGGAGLGALASTVQIPADEYPAGRFTLHQLLPRVQEGASATLRVSRENYSAGAVSVTVRVAAGTAQPGQDFNPGWTDVTLNWADGEQTMKTIALQFVEDGTREPAETATFELVAPTGGAVVGESFQTTVSIEDARRNRSRDGGGGGFGSLGAMLLGMLATLRRGRLRPEV
jgi:uncharacterized delta-60 repeat protein